MLEGKNRELIERQHKGGAHRREEATQDFMKCTARTLGLISSIIRDIKNPFLNEKLNTHFKVMDCYISCLEYELRDMRKLLQTAFEDN